jgi:hypothetical protein
MKLMPLDYFSISADVCCLSEPTESSTSNPGTTSTSNNDNTIQPTTDSQTTSSSSSSQSNTTPKASEIVDNTISTVKLTESQADHSRPETSLIAALSGGIMGAVLLIIVVVIAVASFAICVRRSRKCNKKANLPSATSPANNDDDYLSINYNYGIPMRPGAAKCRYSLENVYDTPHAAFPSVEKTVETKRNEAYNVTLATVDEVTKPTQGHTSFEYDYVQ